MTTKYNKPEEVPTEILVKRLDELSDAVAARMQGNNAKFQREFTCRIPAELDRDADLVLNGAAMRISELVKRIAKLEKYNLALANESHAKSERIAELEAYLDNVKTLSIYVAFHDSARSVSLKQAGEWLESFKLEQQAKGVRHSISYIEDNFDYGKRDLHTLLMEYAEKIGGGAE